MATLFGESVASQKTFASLAGEQIIKYVSIRIQRALSVLPKLQQFIRMYPFILRSLLLKAKAPVSYKIFNCFPFNAFKVQQLGQFDCQQDAFNFLCIGKCYDSTK